MFRKDADLQKSHSELWLQGLFLVVQLWAAKCDNTPVTRAHVYAILLCRSQ